MSAKQFIEAGGRLVEQSNIDSSNRKRQQLQFTSMSRLKIIAPCDTFPAVDGRLCESARSEYRQCSLASLVPVGDVHACSLRKQLVAQPDRPSIVHGLEACVALFHASTNNDRPPVDVGVDQLPQRVTAALAHMIVCAWDCDVWHPSKDMTFHPSEGQHFLI